MREKLRPLYLNPYKELLPVVCGSILLLLATPPATFFVTSYIAFSVALFSLTNPSRSFYKGFLFGLFYTIGSMYWIVYVLSKYGNIPWIFSALLFMLLAGYLSLYPAAFFFLYSKLKGKMPDFFMPFIAASIWVVFEYIRTYFLTGFPWLLLGYTQFSSSSIMQVSKFISVYGLGFIIIFVNVSILLSVVGFRVQKLTMGALIVLSAIMIIATIVSGRNRLEYLKNRRNDGRNITIMCVQGNVDQAQKWDKELQKTIFDKYLILTHKALKEPVDIVVWPETALPFIYGLDENMTEYFRMRTKDDTYLLLSGFPGFRWDEENQGRLTNSAGVFYKGELLQRYDKVHMVPFGEYVPLKKVLFFVNKLIAMAGDFLPGERHELVEANGLKIGFLICYESIFPDISNQYKKSGANIIVNITNDAWFGKTSAPYQHLIMSSFRAVENESFLVRVANTGVSCVITPWGEQISATKLFEENSFIAKIYF